MAYLFVVQGQVDVSELATCRAYAAHYRAEAAVATLCHSRTRSERIADVWTRMADRIEIAEALRAEQRIMSAIEARLL